MSQYDYSRFNRYNYDRSRRYGCDPYALRKQCPECRRETSWQQAGVMDPRTMKCLDCGTER